MWKRDRRNSYGWQRAFATAAAYASHNPTARQWPVRESDSRLGHCPKTKICLLAAQGGWTARSTGGTLVEPNLTAVGVQSHRERASWRSIRPNFCAGSQSNSRLSPPEFGWGQSNSHLSPPEFGWGQSNSRLTPTEIGRGQSNNRLTPTEIGWGQSNSRLTPLESGWGQTKGFLSKSKIKRSKKWVLS